MDHETDWANDWAVRIGSNLRNERRRCGFTAQEFADKCTELGYPISRSTVAKIESGRKRDIPVQEVLVFAKVLDVAPPDLLFDLRTPLEEVWVLPKLIATSVEGAAWFSGNWTLPDDRAFFLRGDWTVDFDQDQLRVSPGRSVLPQMLRVADLIEAIRSYRADLTGIMRDRNLAAAEQAKRPVDKDERERQEEDARLHEEHARRNYRGYRRDLGRMLLTFEKFNDVEIPQNWWDEVDPDA